MQLLRTAVTEREKHAHGGGSGCYRAEIVPDPYDRSGDAYE